MCVDMGQWLARLSIKELGPQYVIRLPFTELSIRRPKSQAPGASIASKFARFD